MEPTRQFDVFQIVSQVLLRYITPININLGASRNRLSGQLGADGALAADLAFGDAVDVLRYERTPVAISLAQEGVTAFAEEIIEEAHV